jgi:hypothetical protein
LSDTDDLAELLGDRDRGHLLRWSEAIEDHFRRGGEAKRRLLEAYAERIRLDFWREMQSQAGRSGKLPSWPPARWAEKSSQAIISHNRGMCAAGMLDERQSEVLMDVVQKTLREIMGPGPDEPGQGPPEGTVPIAIDQALERILEVFRQGGLAAFQEGSPRIEELKAIGWGLHLFGGLEAMQEGSLPFHGEHPPEDRYEAYRRLVLIWDRIGDWRA